ncbi:unnamed protein product [Paramecium sonneborni]|uniref:Transmembrane protein n=1 Tax=Paramecium sonneborni TaxID=65129 RepID=A0A8S1Q038_9CILI|nr:unnamed protein product [Paramecium sonneborni]
MDFLFASLHQHSNKFRLRYHSCLKQYNRLKILLNQLQSNQAIQGHKFMEVKVVPPFQFKDDNCATLFWNDFILNFISLELWINFTYLDFLQFVRNWLQLIKIQNRVILQFDTAFQIFQASMMIIFLFGLIILEMNIKLFFRQIFYKVQFHLAYLLEVLYQVYGIKISVTMFLIIVNNKDFEIEKYSKNKIESKSVYDLKKNESIVSIESKKDLLVFNFEWQIILINEMH